MVTNHFRHFISQHDLVVIMGLVLCWLQKSVIVQNSILLNSIQQYSAVMDCTLIYVFMCLSYSTVTEIKYNRKWSPSLTAHFIVLEIWSG